MEGEKGNQQINKIVTGCVTRVKEKKLGAVIEFKWRIRFSQAVQEGFLEEVSFKVTEITLGKLEDRA